MIGNDRGWAIDYTLPRAAAAQPRLPPANQKLGVRFTETMKGFFSLKVKDDFGEGERRGKADGSSFQFILTIISDDLRGMIKGDEHRARIVGVVIAPKLSRKPLTVTEGVFNLLMDDPDDPDARLMKYRMKLTSEEGKTFYFYGFKTVKNDPGPRPVGGHDDPIHHCLQRGQYRGAGAGSRCVGDQAPGLHGPDDHDAGYQR